MAVEEGKWRDEHLELIISKLLRFGVSLAATVVLTGGVLYLIRHGAELPQYRTFHGEPLELRTFSGMLHAALALKARAIIQVGLVLLIATPVARVIFSLFAFALQRDWMYVAITTVVLAVLLVNLLGGGRLTGG